MDARLNLFGSPVVAKIMKNFIAAGHLLRETDLPYSTLELVNIRASQINGCGVCIDIHTKELAHAGESATRINLVATWRESTVFTEAERAALELAEQGTRMADAAGGVTDEVWENAAKHYSEAQLAALVCAISVINAFNRGNVMVKQPANGDYKVGQLG
ncbi:carboxymuconolactone decarboxylase family protein [Streptodolium elevatio]|uniref:Carboxymuconolactone decarboxylase family protein n=1 Tax=Streptodolium elevatio TaxID=3157996 RepID=A0ABV3DKT9_9ACTN